MSTLGEAVRSFARTLAKAKEELIGHPTIYRCIGLTFKNSFVALYDDGSIVVDDFSSISAGEFEALVLTYRKFNGLPPETGDEEVDGA